jgi:hypothetical protein
MQCTPDFIIANLAIFMADVARNFFSEELKRNLPISTTTTLGGEEREGGR